MKKKFWIMLLCSVLLISSIGAGTVYARTRMKCGLCSCKDFVNDGKNKHTHKWCVCGHPYQCHHESK